MKTKNNIIIGIFLISFLMSIGLVFGAITINIPSADQVLNGTILFNITTDQPHADNCSFATTADGNFSVIRNISASQTEFTSSNDTSLLTEALSTTLTVHCINSTSNTETATQTFSIDNTDPICSFSIDRTHIDRQDGIGITVTDASSDTTTITYLYNLTNEGGVQQASSTSQNPSFSNSDIEEIGTANLTLTVTDQVSKTASCETSFLITGADSDSDTLTITTLTSGISILENRNVLMGGLIALSIMVGAFVIVFIFFINKVKK